MNAATIYRGPGTQQRCADADAAVTGGGDLKATAKAMHTRVGTLKKLAAAHRSMASYTVTLERTGSKTMTLCTVITPNGVWDAVLTAWRRHRVTLNRLELPGWKLRAGSQLLDLADVRAEAKPKRRAA